ncbi:T9SS type A sorting domain-containing protein [bacterium]|nr:T9SS type A sorting domain-containing protein [bacterium]
MRPHRFLPLVLVAFLFALASYFDHPFSGSDPVVNTGPAKQVGEDLRERPPKVPAEFFMRQRLGQNLQALDHEKVQRAKEAVLSLPRSSELDEPWTFEGPTNIGGRITAIAVHPDYPDTVYAGAALGGVLASYDGGEIFEPIFNEYQNLSIGAMAVDPNDHLKLWVGTGEANSSGDSYEGYGIFLTEDGGESWELKGLEASAHIGKIAIDPSDTDRIFVAAAGKLFGTNSERGVYRTTDGGDSWERVLFVNDSTGCIDVAVDPDRPDTVYAAMWERVRRPWERRAGGEASGIYRSTDGGDSWEELTDGLPDGDDIGRIGLAVAPSDPDRVYAFYCDHPGYFIDVYRSDDNGESWSAMNVPSWIGNNICSSFGWYFGQIRVAPDNENEVYILGVNMAKSFNGGSTWNYVFDDAHVDHHDLWINPNNPDDVISGHDGGVNRSTNGGSSSDRFTSLPVTQYYAISIDPHNPDHLYGGTQDNGTMRRTDDQVDNYDHIYGGDGFYTWVNWSHSNVVTACYQWGGLGISYNGGNYFNGVGAFSNDRTNWMTPYIFDPHNPDVMWLGTNRVWRGDTFDDDNWDPVSADLTGGPGPTGYTYGTITTIDVSPADSNVIWVGTDDARVWLSQDRGDTWDRVGTDDLPELWVTRVVPHPDSASVVYVTFSGYEEGDLTPHIRRSDDYGDSWSNPVNDIPPGTPVNDLIIDPQRTSDLYAGTDWGVLVSTNHGAEWSQLGTGLPSSAVFDLDFHPESRELVAGTHGRSMWSYQLEDQSGDPPTSFALLMPEDSVAIAPDTLGTLTFTWQESFDPDPGANVRYHFFLTMAFNSFSFELDSTGLTDTTFRVDLLDELPVETWSDTLAGVWLIEAISQGDTTVCDTPFVFFLLPNMTSVEEETSANPTTFAVEKAWPNPFNDAVQIRVALPESSTLQVRVYDIAGREVADLSPGAMRAGRHDLTWKPHGLSSGVYFMQVRTASGNVAVQKVGYVK